MCLQQALASPGCGVPSPREGAGDHDSGTNQRSLFVFGISIGRRGQRGLCSRATPQHCRAAASEAAPGTGNGLGEQRQGVCFQ